METLQPEHLNPELPNKSAAPPPVIPVAQPVVSDVMLPYASGPGEGAIWRRGMLLVTGRQQVLPARCVKCNAPAAGKPIRCKIWWHEPALYFALFAGVLIYVIVAAIVQKKATLHAYLCERHRRRRRNGTWAGLTLFIAALALLIFAVDAGEAVYAIMALLAMVAGLIVAVISSPVLRPKRIDERLAWTKGCCEAFLDQFPLMT